MVFTLVWYVVLLRLVRRPERILQTTTAVFGFQAVLSPLLVISVWLMRRFAQDHDLAASRHPHLAAAADLDHRRQQSHRESRARMVEPPSVCLVILQMLAGQICWSRAVSPCDQLTVAASMHVHILGICGTFMGGIAAIARAAGHRVTGSDRNVYPPMSTQLEALGIDVIQGFEAAAARSGARHRGRRQRHDARLPGRRGVARAWPSLYFRARVARARGAQGPLGARGRRHSRQDHDLLVADLDPGARGTGPRVSDRRRSGQLRHQRAGSAQRRRFFVIEADEYDTAFFDKRAKFVHYRPRTAILNNLEYDHADIYPDVASIQRQFHHLVRIVPGGGRIVWNAGDERLRETLAMGCWTPLRGICSRRGGNRCPLDRETGRRGR